MSPLTRLYARRAELMRELLELDRELFATIEALQADAVLSLEEAAAYMGEPIETFRRRPENLKARVSLADERRSRYSRAELDRIKRDRMAANAVCG